jgi:plasmid stability protein
MGFRAKVCYQYVINLMARRLAMASLTIRNLDNHVIAILKQLAKAHNRSLEAEVREILKRDAARADLIARAELIAAMTPDVPQTDSTKLLREDRDR